MTAFVGESGCTVGTSRLTIELSGTALVSLSNTHETFVSAHADGDSVRVSVINETTGAASIVTGAFSDATPDILETLTWGDELGTAIAATDTVTVIELPSLMVEPITTGETFKHGDRRIATTTAGVFTANAPANPVIGTSFQVFDGDDWSTYTFTIGKNGKTIAGIDDDLDCNVQGIGIELVYSGTTWLVFPITTSSGNWQDELTFSSVAPTTADVTGAVNTFYTVDISGLDAIRSVTVPAGNVGDEMWVKIGTTDDAYELNIKGVAGVQIDGETAATAWSKGPIFIKGETVGLKCRATNDWTVVHDGRIPSSGMMYLTTNKTNLLSDMTFTKLVFDTAVSSHNVGDITKLDTSNYFEPRRSGKYSLKGGCRIRNTGAMTGAVIITGLRDNQTTTTLDIRAPAVIAYAANAGDGSLNATTHVDAANLKADAGRLIFSGYQNSGSTADLDGYALPPQLTWFSCEELL